MMQNKFWGENLKKKIWWSNKWKRYLKSQAGICGGNVVQELIRVLADERLLVIASNIMLSLNDFNEN